LTPALLVLWAGYAAQVILVAGLLVATLRVLAGPTLADRVLGLDLLVAIAIGFIGVTSVVSGHTLYIDIALALALVGFLATIAFARYIGSQADKGGDTPIAWPKGMVRQEPASGVAAKPGKSGKERSDQVKSGQDKKAETKQPKGPGRSSSPRKKS